MRNRMGEDPDVLRDLVQQARGVPLDVQRITGTEIRSLKTTGQRSSSVNVSFTRMISGFFSGLFGGLIGLFSPPSQKKNQCAMYGHVRPKGGWAGNLPHCEDCGAEIHSEDDLRGSTARH